ncbi:hypothetical protein THAOC_07053 [Thalassiosira oceanica]|uniref:Protein kinase domain-containing protein n=1 Tax=Thalassiosira oceanica TaxID=159749 RepID=K0T178_THAOC|nr:hypothetical protein THAOC_07053 [Thalassiosira oceanica]|eukprot:EJK71500.1 hypothetical protein THAOC_07053 [Thalassiosira oceanica]
MVSIRLSRRKSCDAEGATKETMNKETLEDEALDLSVRSLNTMMIRTRTDNVFDFYKEVKTLGEGSIGTVVLVRRRRGTEGGSAYSHQDKGCFGFLSCLPRRRPRTLEKSGPRARLSMPNHSLHAKEYALKSIQLRLVERKYLVEFRNEINVMRSLDHPNIVKAYEVYETERNIYILMEYCSGGDLYSRAPYTETEAAKIVSHLCSAISHMHKNGCVHRDLKFENIMFQSKRQSAQIQVLDFGLSKRFLPGAPKTMTGARSAERGHHFVKSVGWCSYFDLAAILAWSLFVNGTDQTSSALRKTIEETRHCTEVIANRNK